MAETQGDPRTGKPFDADASDIPTRFTYHTPNANQIDRYQHLRNEGRHLADLIVIACPASRERSLALTKVEEAVMWANAAIARRDPR